MITAKYKCARKGFHQDGGRWAVGSLLMLTILSGCHSVQLTQPPRTAAELLILSKSMDAAVDQIDLSVVGNRRVFLVESYFEGIDKGYGLGSIRELISENGGLLTAEVENADLIVEARSGGLGMDRRDSLLGFPAVTLPIPFAGHVETPEIVLYKTEKLESTAKFALLVYERESGAHVHSTGPLVGHSKFHYHKLLGYIGWRRTDVPELDLRSYQETEGGE